MRQNQHYIPRFYLRSFSHNGKSINVFNLKTQKIANGSIDTQCAKSNFYGEDKEIENALSHFEDKISVIYKKILDNGKLMLTDNEYFSFLTYIFLQHGRTQKSSDSAFNIANIYFETIKNNIYELNKGRGWSKESFDKVKLSHKVPAIEPSILSMLGVFLFDDMKHILIINNTSKDFVTSDAPVILFNTYFNGTVGGINTGYANKGLQIFYPLSTKYMMYFYDPIYYHDPVIEDSTISISENKYVKILNGLQMLFCLNNIYFLNNSKDEMNDLLELYKELCKKRGDKTEVISKGLRKSNKGYSELILLNKEQPIYSLKYLPFIKVKPMVDPVPGIRNQEAINNTNEMRGRILKRFGSSRSSLIAMLMANSKCTNG